MPSKGDYPHSFKIRERSVRRELSKGGFGPRGDTYSVQESYLWIASVQIPYNARLSREITPLERCDSGKHGLPLDESLLYSGVNPQREQHLVEDIFTEAETCT